MIRIAIAGGPGAGKSTLARSLVNDLQEAKLTVAHITEYARDFINSCQMEGKYQRSLADQIFFMDRQSDLEVSVPSHIQVMVTDAPVFSGLVYALDLLGTRDTLRSKRLAHLWEMYGNYESVFLKNPYDLVFWLDVPKDRNIEDGTRIDSNLVSGQIGDRILGLCEFLGYDCFPLRNGYKVRALTNMILALREMNSEVSSPPTAQ